jgi:hypothetical protein
MTSTDVRRTYWIITGVLAAVILVALLLALLPWALARPQQDDVPPTPTPRPTPTSIPTLAGTSERLLVCQRQVGLAMNARQMVGAANLADNGQLSLRWVSLDWPVTDLDDALPGVITALDVALEVWKGDCAVYDRVSIDVYDRRQDAQAHRLTVRAQMNDLLRWQAGELGDPELLDQLRITQIGAK